MRRFLSLLFAILFLAFLPPAAHAFDVSEFDDGFGDWSFSPQNIGRSSTEGWKVVSNDSEKAARNSTTGTRYTYYWKLTRVLDLTHAIDPELDIKLHFKGHNYEYARIQVGDENASRLADFTTLHEVSEGTDEPEELRLDLAEYVGGKITVRVLLKKPYDVTENKIGLYVHRIGVVSTVVPDVAPTDPGILSVGGFNIQVFGRSKMRKEGVPEILAEVVGRFDLLVVQEIRDASGEAIVQLLDQVNESVSDPYEMVLSDRLGRTSSKEQYAFFYRPSKLTVMDQYHYADPMDEFEREPFLVRFQTVSGGKDFGVVALHADPDDVPAELAALEDVLIEAEDLWNEEDLMVIGDLNAGCSYLTNSEQADLSLWTDVWYTSWIENGADTTVSSTWCPYDRIITTGEASDLVVPGSAQTFFFDQAYELGPTMSRKVSDHYPVEVLMEVAE
jgi:deoxyribonuclease-1